MFQYDRFNVLEGIGINKSNKSKKCMICNYWYFKDIGYNFQPYICNVCHDVSMMAYDVKNIDAINTLNNSKLDDRGTL